MLPEPGSYSLKDSTVVIAVGPQSVEKPEGKVLEQPYATGLTCTVAE